jgi:hypothetical protein
MTDFTITDRLYLLSTYRLTLRHNLFPTPEAILQASDERLAELHMHRAAIVQLVREADPDVMRALFLPRASIDWVVAGSAHDANVRLLSVTRRVGAYSANVLLNHRYRIDDEGSEERAAWITLRDVLRASAVPCRSHGSVRVLDGCQRDEAR